MTWGLWGLMGAPKRDSPIEKLEDTLDSVVDKVSEVAENTPEVEVMEFKEGEDKVVSGMGYVSGETFVASKEAHGGLVELLQDKYGSSIQGGATHKKGANIETMILKKAVDGSNDMKNKYSYLESSLKETMANLEALREFINKGYDKVIELGKKCDDDMLDSQLNSVQQIHKMVLEELDNQLSVLKNLLNIKLEPTSKHLSELVNKHKDYMKVMELLSDHDYGTKEASDRLALAFSGVTQVGSMKDKVSSALKDLGMTVKEYKSTHNLTDLRKELYDILKKMPAKKLEGEEINDVFMAMDVLENHHVYKDMLGGMTKKETYGSMMKKAAKSYGEEYKSGGIPQRSSKPKKSLKKRIANKQKTQKEVIKAFIRDINIRFNSMKNSIDSISMKIGEEVPYDENMKEFITAFSRLQELNKENLYFALLEYDQSSSMQKQIKSKFLDDLDIIMKSLDELIKGKYGSYFNNVKQNIVSIMEVIDTYTSLLSGLKKSKVTGGKGACKKASYSKVYQDLTSNSINLISGISNKLEFYGKVATIRENLDCVSKEHASYSNGYDQLLGQAIGEELTRINKEYVEAKALLESSPDDEQDNLLALKYDKEARTGLYKTIEAIDLYLMNFSDAIAKNPKAVNELEKMLQSTQIIAQWFVSRSGDNFKELLESEFSTKEGLYEATKKAFESISVLKNILSMFIHIGEKFGSVKLQDKIHMSANTIYKNLVKYTWVSAVNKADGKLKKVDYDITYETDDAYFIMCIRSIIAKILTVVGTYSIFKKPEKPQNMITNPVRLILGGNDETPEIIDDAVELYIRLPLLVEFYKKIFDNGNETYKQNQASSDDTEIIAFIPEMGSMWSNLIKIIFDNSKFISNAGLYSIQNIKDIVREVNKIYKYYASKNKESVVRDSFCGLISEINRRYGILKKCDVNEYYQLQKRYKSTYIDNPAELSTNFDILNSIDERNLAGPSALYTRDPLEPIGAQPSSSIKTNDLRLIEEFRNRVEGMMDMKVLEEVSKYSFNERLRYYKEELKRTSGNDKKFDLVVKAVEQSNDTSRNNLEAYILFHELVVAPCNSLKVLYNICKQFSDDLSDALSEESSDLFKALELLYIFTGDTEGLVGLKFITNSKIALTYDDFETMVSNAIDNIKYMISKFRTVINPSIIAQFEEAENDGSIYYLEDMLLNHFIKNSVESSETDEEKKQMYSQVKTLDFFVDKLNKFLEGETASDDELFKYILWEPKSESGTLEVIRTLDMPMSDAFKKFDYKQKEWKDMEIRKVNRMFNLDGRYNDEKGIVSKFNHLLSNYLREFYDDATRKIYGKLFSHTAEQTFSSIVYGKGIADVSDMPFLPNSKNAMPENNIVLCASVAYTMRQLLSRSLNPQLDNKYHMLYDLQSVAPHMVEEYRAKLPVFIKLFKFLSDKCMLYKRVLENDIISEDAIEVDSVNITPINKVDEEGNPIDILSDYRIGTISKADRVADYKQVLNNVIEGCASVMKDAQNVLDEVVSMDGKPALFFEIKNDFIKDYYMFSKTLPFMPASSMLYALQKPSVMLPNNKLHTPSFKFLYGVRSVLNGEKQGLEQMPYMKELFTTYNNTMRVANQVDMKNISQLMEQLVTFTRFSTDMVSYKSLLSTSSLDMGEIDGNTTFSLSNNIDQVIDLTQNSFVDTNKHKLFTYAYKFADEIEGTGIMENKSRDHARLLNIIDVNVVPINVHALMKEVPLANVYNYSISYGHMIDRELPSGGAAGVFKNLLKNPYVELDLSSPVVQSVINGNIPELHLFKPRFLSDQLWSKCEMEQNPERFDMKIVRDTTWFINIQRMLRRKIRNELSEIKTKIIDDNQITSRQLTDYSGEHTEQNDNEFEFVF